MSIETKLNLDEETIDLLQDLIQVNIDSAEGFREAAELLKDEMPGEKLLQIAGERDQQARALQEYVTINRDEPCREGSYSAALHRIWMSARAMMSGNDVYAVLAEAERGEDQIKTAYESALKKHPGTAMNDVLLSQYEQIKRDHDLIKHLRDSAE